MERRVLVWRRGHCDNSCLYSSSGFCIDGGPGSQYEYSSCAYGTDCADCGPRSIWESKEFYIELVTALVLLALFVRSFTERNDSGVLRTDFLLW